MLNVSYLIESNHNEIRLVCFLVYVWPLICELFIWSQPIDKKVIIQKYINVFTESIGMLLLSSYGNIHVSTGTFRSKEELYNTQNQHTHDDISAKWQQFDKKQEVNSKYRW